MSDRTYNGWTNYETWCVNLWMDNEPGTADQWREEARAAIEVAREDLEATDTEPVNDERVQREAVHVLAQMIRSAHEEWEEGVVTAPAVFGDLLRAALSEVNWHEIARHYIESVEEEANAN